LVAAHDVARVCPTASISGRTLMQIRIAFAMDRWCAISSRLPERAREARIVGRSRTDKPERSEEDFR
jgi:hypothetical protein